MMALVVVALGDHLKEEAGLRLGVGCIGATKDDSL